MLDGIEPYSKQQALQNTVCLIVSTNERAAQNCLFSSKNRKKRFYPISKNEGMKVELKNFFLWYFIFAKCDALISCDAYRITPNRLIFFSNFVYE